MAVETQERLTVRVGVGLGAFQRGASTAERYWEVVDLLEELGYDSLWLAVSNLNFGLAVSSLNLLHGLADTCVSSRGKYCKECDGSE